MALLPMSVGVLTSSYFIAKAILYGGSHMHRERIERIEKQTKPLQGFSEHPQEGPSTRRPHSMGLATLTD